NADELKAATGGDFTVSGGFAAHGVSIDSRSLAPRDMFVAIEGERDGHDFVADALARQAAGAMVAREPEPEPGPAPLLVVDDTLAALQRLGGFARVRSSARFAAVTGSVGKSTTKEMLRRIFAAFGPTHAAEASFNNHLGVPLTLARTPREADFAVIEIGMNNPGEIAPLAALARPHVAIITTIAATHIGHLGSLDAIVEEKGSLLTGLSADGAAVLPCGTFLARLARHAPDGARIIGFGADERAEAQLIEAASDAEGVDVTACILNKTVRFRLGAPGRHMAMNAVAALAAAASLGLDAERAAAALDGFLPLAGRGARRRITLSGGDALLLDESYNASGASVQAALSVLALQPGRHVVVLGDMLELGDHAEYEHRALAEPVAAVADIVFACGPQMRMMFQDLPAHLRGNWAEDAVSLAPRVAAALRAGDAVLVKGSLGSRMRSVIAAIEGAA
ncbi:MAG TPA: UDP-N-acetylmuramoyl-tripeptide--D-alanyl-D-alanine ligase, partial [Acetobacteraceae bacterium]|nr:UDP-N-acetylmuramoyl-tripeptide--D-alanyl-D-alanine ligase [Acetobacteraceae bacterium]